MRITKTLKGGGKWHFFVLTFSPKDWKDPWEAYSNAGKMWNKGLLRWIKRRFPELEEGGKVKWVQTWERTKRGWPHANVMLQSSGLDDFCERAGYKTATTTTKKNVPRESTYCPAARKLINAAAIKHGFGLSFHMEVAHNAEALGAYVAKLGLEMAYGSQKGQTPTGAPQGFRRVRSSIGALPPRVKAEPGEYAYALTTAHNPEHYQSLDLVLVKKQAKEDWLRGASEAQADKARAAGATWANILLDRALDFQALAPLDDFIEWQSKNSVRTA
jgi:hypothetical protein